jgi:hypothetical protein
MTASTYAPVMARLQRIRQIRPSFLTRSAALLLTLLLSSLLSSLISSPPTAQASLNNLSNALLVTGPGSGPGGVGDTTGSSILEIWLNGGEGTYTDTGCSTAATDGSSVG